MSHSLQPNAKVVFQNSDVKFIAEKDVKLFVKLSWIVHMDHLLSFRFSVWKNHTHYIVTLMVIITVMMTMAMC